MLESPMISSAKEQEELELSVNEPGEGISVPNENGTSIGKTRVWKQRESIHTLLKKGRVLEIRKLSRRIAALRLKKGNDHQKAKNQRKVANLLLEIEAMKDYLTKDLTERTLSILQGLGGELDREIWEACSSADSTAKLLQRLSDVPLNSDGKKYVNLGFLRILSCKSVYDKLKLVKEGVNINPHKYKSRPKRRLKSKKTTVKNAVKSRPEGKKRDKLKSIGKKSPTTVARSVKSLQSLDSSKNALPGIGHTNKHEEMDVAEEVSFAADSFFLTSMNTTEDEANTDDEFSAPVISNEQILDGRSSVKKPNRMGQRKRRVLRDKQLSIDKARVKKRPSILKDSKRFNTKFRATGLPSKSRVPREGSKARLREKESFSSKDWAKKVVDGSLHPSWQAKQRARSTQKLQAFAGTKTTFDD